MSDVNHIISSFELLTSIQNDISESFSRLFDISMNVKEEKKKLLSQLPYHINVIDELHINENAHSWILAKILQFRDTSGKYEILESLIDFIKRKKGTQDFNRIKVEAPIITQEKERVDLWVRDNKANCALIFENKIYDATDQESQLYRYIKATKEHGFDNDDIYVFYLTKYGDEPSEQTWGDDKTKLLFAPRFMQLSFREDILQWLKNDILPFIRQKDNYLLCAISQYVDYLEGIFSLRNIHKSLNMNIQKIISDKLGLSAINDLRERYEKIQETLDDLDTLQNSLIGIKEQVYQELIQQYVSDWKSSFIPPSEKFQISDYDGWDESILFGVKFMCDDKPTHVVIGFENNNNGLFCQVERDLTLRKELLNEDTLSIYTLAKSYLKRSNNNYIYQYFGHDFQAVFNKFRELVKAIDIAI